MDIRRPVLWGILLLTAACRLDTPEYQGPKSISESETEGETGEQSGAGLALEAWYQARFADPGQVNPPSLMPAYEKLKQHTRTPDKASWRSIGPKNIGGRTLCLAFHPTDPNVLFAGSASGGLWKTSSSGLGYHGWVQVPIDLPVYSVASILISPRNPNLMFIGTGEVYNKAAAAPGIVDRTTRGTYGMGILKSTDGGKSWKQSLNIGVGLISGVQDMEFDPFDDYLIYAATTHGLYKSTNQGQSWSLIHNVPMAVDVDINPHNPEIVFVSHGSFQDGAFSGIYRSNNSGQTFTKLKNGLPSGYSGKAKIDISRSNPDIIYASVANAFKSIGLFMSVDGGNSWDLMNQKDVADVQGWYSHDVAIHSTNPDYIAYVGQNAYISDNQGTNFINVTSWDAADMGRVPVGGPEGIGIYVHADIHAAYFHPKRPDEIYFATDGGIFVSRDKGMSFEGRNGGYVTSQFYANFSASRTDPEFAIGGMQDNGTAIYDGQDAWIKVIGGDGMSTAINPFNENVIFGSFQYFGLNRSTDRGKTFEYLKPANSIFLSEPKAFNTPFEVIASSPNSIYAGAQKVYLNESSGNPAFWKATHSSPLDPESTVLTLAVAPSDPSIIFASTSPLNNNTVPKVFKSTDAGKQWTRLTNLPNKSAMDIAIDPTDSRIVYIVFSGFGAGSHVFKSFDGGASWSIKENGLPDVPVNCIVLHPKNRNELFLGNDLGVFYSKNQGESWEKFMEGLPNAVMAMSISIPADAESIKVATHGNGVFESNLPLSLPVNELNNPYLKSFVISPNPAYNRAQAALSLEKAAKYRILVNDLSGKTIFDGPELKGLAGLNINHLDLSGYPSGTYLIGIRGQILEDGSGFQRTLKVVKR